MAKGMKCPVLCRPHHEMICGEEFTEKPEFRIHLSHFHTTSELVHTIAADMIPRSKVAAKIKELYPLTKTLDTPYPDYATFMIAKEAKIEALKELLNDTKVE